MSEGERMGLQSWEVASRLPHHVPTCPGLCTSPLPPRAFRTELQPALNPFGQAPKTPPPRLSDWPGPP